MIDAAGGVRLEQADDRAAVRAVHLEAFGGGHGEVVAELVDALRQALRRSRSAPGCLTARRERDRGGSDAGTE